MALSEAAVLSVAVSGLNGSGSLSLPGAKVGDVVLNIRNDGSAVNSGGDFEATISVNNQVQQTTAANLSTKTITFILFRPEIVVASV